MSARIRSRSVALAVTTLALLAALLAGTTTSASAAYTTAGPFAGGKVQYLMCST